MSGELGFFARWGQALVMPRAAAARTDADPLPGRPAGDLVRALAIVLVVAHTRELVAAGWIGVRLGWQLAMPALNGALMATAAVPLAFVVLAAPAITLAAGARRQLGRDVDLACVAALAPAMIVLVASTVGRLVPLGAAGRGGVLALAIGWGALIAIHGVRVARRRT